MTYSTRIIGAPHSHEHRVYIEKDGKVVSPFHDIPLYANAEKTILNMVVEIPRWTNAKLEISKEEAFNPIKQDEKKGKLRFVRNVFPHHGYIWNYGAFPQTWEDPGHTHPDTKAKGDNDPLDVVEIGELVGTVGQVKQVKVLGTMALLDEGETDWKVIAIDVNDPVASKLNDIEDVEKFFPGLLRATNEWFRIYKIPDGKPENNFAFSGEAKNKAYAEQVIVETNDAWKKLVSGSATETYKISLTNNSVADSPYKVDFSSSAYSGLPSDSRQPANPIDPSRQKDVSSKVVASHSRIATVMSFDINWSLLSDGEVAEKLRTWLNDRFQEIERPSFLGPLHVAELEFGDVPPHVEIQDITDVASEFYLPDDIDIYAHNPTQLARLLSAAYHPRSYPDPNVSSHTASSNETKSLDSDGISFRADVEVLAAGPGTPVLGSEVLLEEVIEEYANRMRRETDVQTEIRNSRISVSTELIVNQPTPNFMVLPLTLTLTGFAFTAVAMISYLGDRINFCFKEPADSAG
ncbi:Inorganic pyrophosphatase, partial [Irineochytrium annulatum]